MLGFLSQLLIALLSWIEERAKRGHVAIDADRDDGSIRRAGARVREWLRKDGAGAVGKPDSSGAEHAGADLHPYRRGVDPVSKPSRDS